MNPDEFRRSVLAKRADAAGEKKKVSPVEQAGNLIGGLFGAALGSYCGVFFLLPFVGCLAVALVARKLFNTERKPVLFAFSIQTVQFIWLLGGVLLQHQVAAGLFAMIWLLSGLIWLTTRPGLLPACLLAVYQLIGLAVNLPMLIHAQAGTQIHKALLVQLVWHVVALIALGIFLFEIRRRRAVPEATDSGCI